MIPDDASPLPGTEVHLVESRAVADEFKVLLGHCGDTVSSPPATLWLTDANGTFGAAVDVIRGLQLEAHLPPMLVVGIGYRRGPLLDTLDLRTRDLTPTVDPAHSRRLPTQPRTGGAPAFLSFIRDELMPWVGARVSFDPNTTTFFGHSFGGLFGCWTVLSAPTTFTRYICASPSLWWDGHAVPALLDALLDAPLARDVRGRVHLVAGEYEDPAGRHREVAHLPPEPAAAELLSVDLLGDARAFADRLAALRAPGCEVSFETLPGEFHISVAPLALSRGLRAVFDAPR